MSSQLKTIKDFAWQEGYGAFTIGFSQIDHTINYLKDQEEHHKKKTFHEEFIEFLAFHRIEFEENTFYDSF